MMLLLLSSQPAFPNANEDNSEKKEARLYIDYFRDFDEISKIRVSLSLREGGQIQYLSGEKVNIYSDEISDEGFIGTVITDENGIGELSSETKEFEQILAKKSRNEFFAVLADTLLYTHDEASIVINNTRFNLECYIEDSVRYVKASLQLIDESGELIPVPDIEINFFVKRMLGLLPIGGSYTYTDENGEVSIEFPDNIVGNSDGEVDIYVRVEGEDELGNLTRKTTVDWGNRLKGQILNERGELWGDRGNAPLFLIIVSNLIILGVWGVILYLIYQVYRIKKLGKKNKYVSE